MKRLGLPRASALTRLVFARLLQAANLRAVFPYVSLWIRSGHGIIIATMVPQTVSYARVEEMNHTAAAEPLRAHFRAHELFALLADQALEPELVDVALARFRSEAGDIISTDLAPYIEYSTPLGTALVDTEVINLRWIHELSRGTVPPLTGVPDERAARRIAALVAHRRRDCAGVHRALAGIDVTGDAPLEIVARDCAGAPSPP